LGSEDNHARGGREFEGEKSPTEEEIQKLQELETCPDSIGMLQVLMDEDPQGHVPTEDGETFSVLEGCSGGPD
jgi:hypothetical protein